MPILIAWLTENRWYLLAGLGLLGLFYGYQFIKHYQQWAETTFGLERQVWGRRRNWALLSLLMVGLLVYGLLTFETSLLPLLARPTPTARPSPQPSPSPSPVLTELVIVDSSGCANPSVTITDPKTGDRITGAYEVRGTADIPNFGFYQLEISGARTNGRWIPVDADSTPGRDIVLGRLDASAYESGDYAFRLVVFDNAGNSPPPCAIAITLLNPRAP